MSLDKQKQRVEKNNNSRTKTISLFRWKSACIVGLRVWVCVRARLDSNGLMRYLCNMCVFVFCRSFLLYVLANLCLHTLFLHTLFRLKRPRPYGIGCFYLFQSIFCVVFYFWEKKIVSSVCVRAIRSSWTHAKKQVKCIVFTAYGVDNEPHNVFFRSV